MFVYEQILDGWLSIVCQKYLVVTVRRQSLENILPPYSSPLSNINFFIPWPCSCFSSRFDPLLDLTGDTPKNAKKVLHLFFDATLVFPQKAEGQTNCQEPGNRTGKLIERTIFCWKKENRRQDSPARISTSTIESPLYSFNCLQLRVLYLASVVHPFIFVILFNQPRTNHPIYS